MDNMPIRVTFCISREDYSNFNSGKSVRIIDDTWAESIKMEADTRVIDIKDGYATLYPSGTNNSR